MSQCGICKNGEIKEGLIVFTAQLGEGLLIVKDVPANICAKCGEEWITPNVMRKLEDIANETRKNPPELQIIKYHEAA